jgi:serine O-acetyltransferase
MIKAIATDFNRFLLTDETTWAKVLFFTQGFSALLNYRIARSIYINVRISILRQLLLIPLFLWRKLIEITTNIYLPWNAEIGPGLHIAHFGFLIVHPQTKIGEYCNLSQGVTIGVKHGGSYQGVPNIGNRVYIAPNAVIIGGIDVGDDVVIGAGAIVTKSVPSRAVVVGNPAKVISYNGSFDYVLYEGMHNDPKRLASLSLAGSMVEPQD